MKRFLFFSLIAISNLAFPFTLITPICRAQTLYFFLISINMIILLMALYVEACKKIKYWGIASVVLQLVIVLYGSSRDYFYTMGFKASRDEPVLFVSQEEPWDDLRTISTYYLDGTLHVVRKSHSDFYPFWVRLQCDSTINEWEVSTDSTKIGSYYFSFDLSDRTFHCHGNQDIEDINWNLLQEIANRENRNSTHLYFCH